MDQEVKIRISTDVSGVVTGFRVLQDELEKTQNKNQTVTSMIKTQWLGFTAAITAAGLAINKAIQFMDIGAQAEQIASSFKIMAEESGTSSEKMIANMEAATKETVAQSELQQKAVKLMLAGYDPKQIEDFSKVAITASQYMGVSVTEAYDRIADSLATRMPRAMVQSGAVTREQMTIVTAAIKGGADQADLMALAISNLRVKQLELQGTQDGSTLAMQRFHAQIKETKESIGEMLDVAGQKLYAWFQFIEYESMLASSGVYKLVQGFDVLMSHMPGTDKASWQKAATEAAANSAADLKTANEYLDKAKANLTGYAEVEKRSSKEFIDLAKEDVAAKVARLKAIGDAAKNAAQDAKNILAGQLSDIKAHYDEAIALDNQWYQTQKENGANAVDLDKQFYDKKNDDLWASYEKQWNAISNSSVLESDKYKQLEALNKTYYDAVGKNQTELTKNLISDEKQYIDVMAAAYKTIGDYSETAMAKEIAKIDEKYKLLHADVVAGSQDEIVLEKAKQTEIFNLRNKGQQDLINLQLSYLELIKGPYSDAYKEMFAESLVNQADALEQYYKNNNLIFDKEAWLTQKYIEEDAKRLEAKAAYYSAIEGMEDKATIAALAAIELRRKLNTTTYGNPEAANIKTGQDVIKLQQDIVAAIGTRFDIEHKFQKDSITNSIAVFDNASSLMDKESNEYKIMQDFKKAAQITELAMEIDKNIQIIEGYYLRSAAAVAAATVQNATNASTAITGAVSSVTAQGSVPVAGFGLVAAMTAIMAGILGIAGIAFGGRTSTSATATAAILPASTVLGAAAGTGSQSIENSYKMLESIYNIEDMRLTEIFRELQDLNSNITGLVTSIVRTGGLTDFTQSIDLSNKMGSASSLVNNITSMIGANSWVGQFYGWEANAIFGGDTKSTMTESGISIGKTIIGSILNGVSLAAQQYALVNATTSGGMFGSDKTVWTYYYDALNGDVESMLTLVFKNLGNTLVTLSKELGVNIDNVLNYVVKATNINLQGMTTDQMNKALQTYISNIADTAVEDLFGTMLKQYQKLNEGLMETAIRLVTDRETIAHYLEMTNQKFEGTIPAAIKFSETLITIAGSLDKLTSAMQSYYDAFFNDTEKQAMLKNQLTEILSQYGMSLPSTRAGYRSLVESQNLTTATGAADYAELMLLAKTADQYYK